MAVHRRQILLPAPDCRPGSGAAAIPVGFSPRRTFQDSFVRLRVVARSFGRNTSSRLDWDTYLSCHKTVKYLRLDRVALRNTQYRHRWRRLSSWRLKSLSIITWLHRVNTPGSHEHCPPTASPHDAIFWLQHPKTISTAGWFRYSNDGSSRQTEHHDDSGLPRMIQ